MTSYLAFGLLRHWGARLQPCGPTYSIFTRRDGGGVHYCEASAASLGRSETPHSPLRHTGAAGEPRVTPGGQADVMSERCRR
jgi:hypothetical protein